MSIRCLVIFAGAAIATCISNPPKDHCTAVAVGPKATVDGSSMVGQTNDGEGGPGSSVVFVPAQDHALPATRPVKDQETGEQIGGIPQVSHTFAYTYTSNGYGLMNEHQSAFGESTCSGRLSAASLAHNGTALFSSQELSMIALERCKSARCAIQVMGDLATRSGGFYGEGTDVDSGSETLVLADPHEAWVFHILADPTGRSAIWAAQRVPDDSVAIVPNTFVIRTMELESEDFLLSSNAKAVAVEFGWWNGTGSFDFSHAFPLGEYNNPHYSSRRMWRAYGLLAPSLSLDPSLEITEFTGAYPFAVKPDHLLTVTDMFRVYRDYYEGTAFSLVADVIAAGPFNSPLRVAGGEAEGDVSTGAWERPISIYRADYAALMVCHSRGHGVVWFAPHVSHSSVFSPIWTSQAGNVARSYSVDKRQSVDHESLFWAASAVSNWAYGSMFSHAILDIRAAQAEWEKQAHNLLAELNSVASEQHSSVLADFAAKLRKGWWDLFWSLMGKYNDGYVITRGPDGAVTSTAVGYPAWWLKAARFDKAIATPSVSFENLNSRMAKAAAKMSEIDANRSRPGGKAAHHEFQLPEITV